MAGNETVVHLRDGSTSLALIVGRGSPEVAFWGPELGDGPIDPEMFRRPVPTGGLDVDTPLGLVAEAGGGWFGRPGLEVSRPDGTDFAPRFELAGSTATDRTFVAECQDVRAGLSMRLEVELDPSGVALLGATVTNQADQPLHVHAFRLTLPVPARAQELLTVGGRHAFEFAQHRTRWEQNCLLVENRRGKTSHERLGVVFAGVPSFGEHHGEVWAVHIGWSGNYELTCDSITDARRVIQAGELLLPGEVTLAPGQSYATPVVYAVYSMDGLNRASRRFHDHLRSRPHHPSLPRPVHLNTWEAVYFDHDLGRLEALADAAAEVGIERFVLDDGWFGGRRNDSQGLGDWWVAPDVWPDGLHHIIDHVRSRGMEFGLWVEPEMVNPDSDLYRAHPDWALVDHRYPPVLGRNQLVLDVGRPEVAEYLFERLDGLLSEYGVSYLKWDHNRDLVAPTSGGRAGAHRQTLGVYRLLDRLRSAHPGVEIETCASGGGRVDFGILDHTDRVWTSDSIDALDRHLIQRGFSLLFPLELMGSHVGAEASHSTGRRHRLGFRAVAAVFGAFGVEWDLLQAPAEERVALARLIELHKRFRPLLHTGDVFRADHPDPTVDVQGVIASDRRQALVAITRLASGVSHHTPPILIPGLDPTMTYSLSLVDVGEPLAVTRTQLSWVTGELRETGRRLGVAGLPAPILPPETSLLVHIREAAE